MARLFISRSNSPTFVPGWLVFITARVSAPVYTINPTADPAARTVFDHNTFSAVKGDTDGGSGCKGTERELPKVEGGGGVFRVKVPTKVWISFMGASAGHRIRIE